MLPHYRTEQTAERGESLNDRGGTHCGEPGNAIGGPADHVGHGATTRSASMQGRISEITPQYRQHGDGYHHSQWSEPYHATSFTHTRGLRSVDA